LQTKESSNLQQVGCAANAGPESFTRSCVTAPPVVASSEPCGSSLRQKSDMCANDGYGEQGGGDGLDDELCRIVEKNSYRRQGDGRPKNTGSVLSGGAVHRVSLRCGVMCRSGAKTAREPHPFISKDLEKFLLCLVREVALTKRGRQGAGRRDPEDIQLVRAVQAEKHGSIGRGRAFEAIDRKYRLRVMAWCLYRVPRETQAHDAAQDTLAAAAAGIDQVVEPDRLSAWLYTIAKRRCLLVQDGRRERTIDPADMRLELSEHDQAESDFAERWPFLQRLLRQVIDAMAPAAREFCVAVFVDQLNGEELRDKFGLSSVDGAYSRTNKLKSDLVLGMRGLALARDGEEFCDNLGKILGVYDWKGEVVYTKLLRLAVIWHWQKCQVAELPKHRGHAKRNCKTQKQPCNFCHKCAGLQNKLFRPYAPALAPVLAAEPWDRPLVLTDIDHDDLDESEQDKIEDQTSGQDTARSRSRRRRLQGSVAVAVVAIIALLVLLLRPWSDSDTAANPQAGVAPPVVDGFRPIAYTTLDNTWLLTDPADAPRQLPLASDALSAVMVRPVWSADGRYVAYRTQYEDLVHSYLIDRETGDKREWQCSSCTIAFLGSTLVATDADSPTGFVAIPIDGSAPPPFAVSGLPSTGPVTNVYGNPASPFEFLTLFQGGRYQVYLDNGIEIDEAPGLLNIYRISATGEASAIFQTAELVGGSLDVRYAIDEAHDRIAYVTYVDGTGLTLADLDTQATISSTTVGSDINVAALSFDADGVATAVALPSGSSSSDTTTVALTPQTATVYRAVGDTWASTGAPASITQEVGDGWTVTLTYDSTDRVGRPAATLTLAKPGAPPVTIVGVSQITVAAS
jgi:DNA-directed RNA polymerase specialized sigma24 family protein